MGWYLFQGLIVFGVVASNIHWHWTPNGYLASVIGAGLALIATLLVNDIAALRARKKRGAGLPR
ncbi:hypothetical protein AB4853_10455 [Bradyrhizobium sp. 1050_B9_N1_2]|uniref:hypothetical protein n=1 Tax=Bradyrhizobium sp. 1050_B9_N1_2 TaxID=3238688 RepID=UPI003EDB75B9